MKPAFLAFAILFLTSCAGPAPLRTEAPKLNLTPIKSVTIVKMPEPDPYMVANLGHPGMAFGLVGAVVMSFDARAKQEALTKAFRERGVAVTAHLAGQVESRLRAFGYQTHVEEAKFVVNEVGDRKVDLTRIESQSDAVLVLRSNVIGFVAPKPLADYIPSVWTAADLYGADRTQPLYVGLHAYGWRPVSEQEWRWVESKATFADFDKLMQDPNVSSEALKAAAEVVAEGIAADMRR